MSPNAHLRAVVVVSQCLSVRVGVVESEDVCEELAELGVVLLQGTLHLHRVTQHTPHQPTQHISVLCQQKHTLTTKRQIKVSSFS